MSDELKPCAALVREWFYQDDAGVVRWLKSPGRRVKAGDAAGHYVTKGYLQVQWKGRGWASHRIAFALSHGRWPTAQIDHINGHKDDNRISNLREATNQQNACNRPSRNASTGMKGVTLHRGRYVARCSVGGRSKHLGCFDSAEAAHAAYVSAASHMHGDFASFNTVENVK